MSEDSSGSINCHKSRSKTKQNSKDELDSDDEQEEEQEEGRLNFAGYGKPCRQVGCKKRAIPGNYSCCEQHRDSNLKRKAATQKSIQGKTYSALPTSMRTNGMWSTFLSNASKRNKLVARSHTAGGCCFRAHYALTAITGGQIFSLVWIALFLRETTRLKTASHAATHATPKRMT